MAWRSPYPVQNSVISAPSTSNSTQLRPSLLGCRPPNDEFRLNSSFNQPSGSSTSFVRNLNPTRSPNVTLSNSSYQHTLSKNSQFTPLQDFSHVTPQSQSSFNNNDNTKFQQLYQVPTISHPPPQHFIPNMTISPLLPSRKISDLSNRLPAPPFFAPRQPVNVQNNNYTLHNQSSLQNRYPVINESQITNSGKIPTVPDHFLQSHCTIIDNTRGGNNLMNVAPIVNISASSHVINNNPSIAHYSNVNTMMQPLLSNLMHMPPPPISSGVPLRLPPPLMFKNEYVGNNMLNPELGNETKLTAFLARLSIVKKEKVKENIKIPEFRSALVKFVSISKLLEQSKENLKNLLESNEHQWNSELRTVCILKRELSEICSFISDPCRLKSVLKKIQLIKRKREQKKKTKLNKLLEKEKKEQNRKELHQEIDKWLDDINEKNQKLKREVEMKKEADFILLEVRKKIHEAKRTIEKIKVFEKLRQARQENAVKKGLRLWSQHNENFEKKVTILKDVMRRQLSDYLAEERALKVMLETEQEGQLEEEAQWKVKRAKTHQHNRQKHILECLFGSSGDPSSLDPIYLFHKFQTSANNSIENLVQIRYQWDVHISEEGAPVPQQWVVPVSASDPPWEQCLTTTSGISKQ